jgi:transcriptional regulator with XRE-family HTH domain
MANQGISDFSVRFSAALQGYMRQHKIRIEDVVSISGRSKGYVSEHTSGKSAPDTDLLDAIADAGDVTTRSLVAEVVRRMGDPDAGFGVGTSQAPAPSNPDELANRREQKTYPKPAKKSARKTTPKRDQD